jgi:hypothetical protein
VLKSVKIRSSRFVQSYNFAVNKGFGGKITERLSDLREAFVEVLAVPYRMVSRLVLTPMAR